MTDKRQPLSLALSRAISLAFFSLARLVYLLLLFFFFLFFFFFFFFYFVFFDTSKGGAHAASLRVGPRGGGVSGLA
jgi:hypothetical protein